MTRASKRAVAIVVLGMRSIVLVSIRSYQMLLSPLFGRCCRYDPSCSEYAYQSVRSGGVLWGVWVGLGRILRCHPWAKGGYDPPKLRQVSDGSVEHGIGTNFCASLHGAGIAMTKGVFATSCRECRTRKGAKAS